ncbi:hypothetical protein B0T19DRAFT_484215 [Cercophora scortea]|uniref:Uncharacterized protein n=1 Tax=Cercophora scortea TaxID=314031 RepID=A0AAE0ILB8_9PEZI|nr:hypothetical protein B0T19DRAFT_484215 [Cercophora scortea]
MAPQAQLENVPEIIPASTRFSGTDVVVQCMAQHKFNSIVGPVLYRDIEIHERNVRYPGAGPELQRPFLNSPYINTAGVDHSTRHDIVANDIVRLFLHSMPNLESFTTLGTLRRYSPGLKSLHLRFPDSILEYTGHEWNWTGFRHLDLNPARNMLAYAKPVLAGFAGLHELTLDVLKHSPGLRNLKLSISKTTLEFLQHRSLTRWYSPFLDRLCTEYEQSSGRPLQLRSLHLGRAMAPSKMNPNAVEKLTSLRNLRELHIANPPRLVRFHHRPVGPNGEFDREPLIDFTVFGPANCPELTRLSASWFSPGIHQFLRDAGTQDPAFTRKLAVSFTAMDYRSDGEVPALLCPNQSTPAAHFRMMDLDLDRWPLSCAPGLLPVFGAVQNPAERILADLVSGDAGALEGLAINLGTDGRFGFLGSSLRKLANLTQLTAHSSALSGNLPTDNDKRRRFAGIFATMVPQLRYIRVDRQCWRIWRGRGDAASLRLEELRGREVGDIELFAKGIWVPGLSC